MKRRSAVAGLAGLVFGGGLTSVALGQPSPRVVAVKASKFAFLPAEIFVRKDEPLMLQLSAVDFPHGFGLPDFNLRADLVPGKVVELAFTPDKAGRFHMLCDNFCGEGHDKMSGWLIVSA